MVINIQDQILGGGRTFFIAEVAGAYEGKLENAIKLIDVAVSAKADAIKFQIVFKDQYVVPQHEIYKYVETIELTPAQWSYLREYSRKRRILFFCDIFDPLACQVAKNINPDAVKIHSSDLSNLELIEEAAKIGKPLFLGVGASTIDEISLAINTIRTLGNKNIALMIGYQGFPTKIEDMNLNFIRTLKTLYGLPVGVLDHSEGETFMSRVIPLLTPFIGADVIEKHFCLDRDSLGKDYDPESSVNPETLASIIETLRSIEKAFGTGIVREFSTDELKYRDLMKKSIVTEQTIKEGEMISKDKISFKRAGPGGVKPSDLGLVLGKRAKVNLPKHSQVKLGEVG